MANVAAVNSRPAVPPALARAAAASRPAQSASPSMAADSLQLSAQATAPAAPLFNLSGVKAGDVRPLDGQYGIFSLGGRVEVNQYTDKTLDLTVYAENFFKNQTVKVRFDLLPDGKLKFVSQTVGKSSADADAAQTLTLLSQSPSEVAFLDEQGKKMKLTQDAKGALTFTFSSGDYLTMLPK